MVIGVLGPDQAKRSFIERAYKATIKSRLIPPIHRPAFTRRSAGGRPIIQECA